MLHGDFIGNVVLGMTISVDGFINDRYGSVAALHSDPVVWRETELGRESIHRKRSAESHNSCGDREVNLTSGALSQGRHRR